MTKKTIIGLAIAVLVIIGLMFFFYSTAVDLSFLGYKH